MRSGKLVREWIDHIAGRLEGVVERPRREAELLLMAYLGCDQLWIITHADAAVDTSEALETWIQRRCEHVPLEYLSRRVSFFSREFYVDEGALIPRPETELLIERLYVELDETFEGTIVEVGVGSGVISVMLAERFANARILAVDISEAALAVARKNLEAFGLASRVELRLSDLLGAVDEPIDVLVSNPPYIADDAKLEANLAYEPQNALFGGAVGDEIIRRLLDETQTRGIGLFACEMGYDQKEKVEAYVSGFALQSLEFYKDYAGFDRGFVLRMG